jgi:hypothetical protein
MIEGWEGANEAGEDECELCGETRELRLAHYNGAPGTLQPGAKDHLELCQQCFYTAKLKHWHGCGCGG